ncbi:MAG: TlpA disulfide reductase family protein [Bacteroidota bacterium]
MKTLRKLEIFVLLAIGFPALSQNCNLPDVAVYTLEGSSVSAQDLTRDDQALVFVFWESDDTESLDQIRQINEEYGDLKGKNVRVVGLCADCSGNMARIRPLIYGMGIDFEMYIDRNCDLKRAMNVTDFPTTFLIDQNKHVYSQCLGYRGNLDELVSEMITNYLAVNTDCKK